MASPSNGSDATSRIDPYLAVALQTKVVNVATRDEVKVNLDHIGNMIDLVCHICALELPVRLITLGEGAIQGFIDEIAHLSPKQFSDTMAADMPGWETEFLGEKAKEKNVYILGQLKTKNPAFPDRFFNTVFLIDPTGEVIWQHQKNIVLFVEHSTTPHDVYDEWVKMHGDGLDAFFPVARTPIGNIAGTIGVEGGYPETFRGFALNGAEIFYRGSLPEPWVSREIWDIQNRSRALENTAYMLGTNTGALIVNGPPGTPPTQVDGALGGRSMVVNYKGEVLSQTVESGDCYAAAEINIDALRHFRENAKVLNWIPYIRSEIFRKLYDNVIWPANAQPMKDDVAAEVLEGVVKSLQERGVYEKRDK